MVQALLKGGRAGGLQTGGEGHGDGLGTSYCRRLGDWLLCSTLRKVARLGPLLGFSDGLSPLVALHFPRPTSPSHSGVWPAHSLLIVSFIYLAA